MTKTPEEAWAAHAAAVETARYAEAARYRYWNNAKIFNGYGDERLATIPEYQALIAARDDARDTANEADPRTPAPQKKGKK